MLENTEKLGVWTVNKLKHNPEKAINTKHSKTNLPWFGHLLGYSANKRGGLILQRSQAHTGLAGEGLMIQDSKMFAFANTHQE